MVAAIERRVDTLCNGGPGGTFEASTDFSVGNTQGTKLGLDALESLVESGEINVVAAGTRMNDNCVNDDERMAVGSRLGRSETNVTELSGPTDYGLDDYVAISTTGVVIEVSVHYAHRLHG